jgi:transcriptional regulator
MIPYQPKHFNIPEQAHALAVMRAHPLATLVSVRDGEPQCSHVPLVARESDSGIVLLGHVAKANAHWQHWDGEATVTAIFHGPDIYISPSLYVTRESVPTWNYIVVHAHGTVSITHDTLAKERILKALIDEHDPPYRARWDTELSEEFRERQKGHIVGFEIRVKRLEAKFKISQNRLPADRAGVLTAMQAGNADARELGDWMQRLTP